MNLFVHFSVRNTPYIINNNVCCILTGCSYPIPFNPLPIGGGLPLLAQANTNCGKG